MVKDIIMTEQGYSEMKEELDILKNIRRADIADKIKTARGFGDLSENSEYDEAKNEQAVVEARIQQLEESLKRAKIILKEDISTDRISIGSVVKLHDLSYDEELVYRVVSSVENSGTMDTVTSESPVGKAILGARVGDTVDVNAPSGSFQIKILEINS